MKFVFLEFQVLVAIRNGLKIIRRGKQFSRAVYCQYLGLNWLHWPLFFTYMRDGEQFHKYRKHWIAREEEPWLSCLIYLFIRLPEIFCVQKRIYEIEQFIYATNRRLYYSQRRPFLTIV